MSPESVVISVVAEYDLWIRALHVVGIIAWMAGLLYLPRLFVYHAEAAPGSELSETLKVMERRLLRAIMTPAVVVAFVSGVSLLWLRSPEVWSDLWIYLKLGGLIGLVLCHYSMARAQRMFARDENDRSANYYRVLNEIPTVLMILIVVMVVVQPF